MKRKRKKATKVRRYEGHEEEGGMRNEEGEGVLPFFILHRGYPLDSSDHKMLWFAKALVPCSLFPVPCSRSFFLLPS
ncbi:MAG TPA: hypothetical protein VM223_23265, partial [Planctomycetota bacterium]|nr:hypothetical protein [Planctomycetota bacterium]